MIDIVSIFPDYLAGPLRVSLLGKAVERGLLEVRVHDLRQWASDRHRTVDDTPYGGGAGMVMRPEPWGLALDALVPPGGAVPRLVVPTPAGRPFTQALAAELAAEPWLAFACGRYEGIDQRVVEHAGTRMPVTEVSLGDYVLAGGEAAVLVMIEAVARLLPGFLGNPDSLAEESHAGGLLEYPVYTRPPVWRELAVPDVHFERVAGAEVRDVGTQRLGVQGVQRVHLGASFVRRARRGAGLSEQGRSGRTTARDNPSRVPHRRGQCETRP